MFRGCTARHGCDQANPTGQQQQPAHAAPKAFLDVFAAAGCMLICTSWPECWHLLSAGQAHEKLHHVQQQYDAELRKNVQTATRVQSLEHDKGLAEAEAHRAVEQKADALTRLAALEAVAGEKQRAADAKIAELQVGDTRSSAVSLSAATPVHR